jgi:AcrR family transcriptional regulator
MGRDERGGDFMAGATRERLIESTAELLRRQGYSATGVKQILAEANAPFGSMYHFFPGGKAELGAEAIRTSGSLYMRLFTDMASHSRDPVDAVRGFFAGAAQTLIDTDYADACPIATVALEVASSEETLRRATAEVFGEWIDGVGAYFAAAGLDPGTARHLALSILSLLEGAFVFCRSMRTVEPLRSAGECAAAAVQDALARADARRSGR